MKKYFLIYLFINLVMGISLLSFQKKYNKNRILKKDIKNKYLLAKYKINTIVIDAGHGGKDPGSKGTGRYKTTESDIVLDISLKLLKYLNTAYPKIEVIMTRSKDEFIKLKDRAELANKKSADLFISIHCNSNPSNKHYGAETYVLGIHKNEAQMEVAKRENKVIFIEKNYKEAYQGFDPDIPESMIALSMLQKASFEKSVIFAEMVQSQFRERVNRHDRGVKQAGFWVIAQTVMPAVLIELGFISNPTEEDFLNSDIGKIYLASAIFRACKEYKKAIEGYDSAIKNINEKDAPIIKLPTDKDLIFKVQLLVTGNRKNLKSNLFMGIDEVEEEKTNDLFRYTTGQFRNFEDAVELQKKIRHKQFEDAFPIAIYKGNRISISKALQILNEKR